MRRYIYRSSVCAVVMMAVATTVSAQQVTLEALLAAPFPSEIAASPAGGHVAWVQNARGSRNVWLASAPSFTPRQLTTYSGDDGQDITSLTWTVDGRTVMYVRGGGANRAGEIPNPALTPQPAEQAIWAVDVGSNGASAARKLATGSNPIVSRSGQVVYLSRGQVWTTHVAGTEKPSQLFTIRGGAQALRWSPDGTRLAFVSARGDHSFIGLYDVAQKTLRYLDPSIDLDNNPTWSPDGTRIVFTRVPASRENFMFAPRREGLPWSIRVVDVVSGQASEIWKAEHGAGSVFQGVNAPAQLMWAAGDHIVFPWEREGWLHLYSLPIAGGKAALLTPGNFEVEHVTMSPDRTRVVYSANARTDAADAAEIDRRHLWSVAADASNPPTPLTRGKGAEWMPAVVDADTVAFLRSTGQQPAHAAIARKGDIRVIDPAARPAFVDQLVEPTRVTFTATDGMEIAGQLFVPRDLKPGEKRPAILFFHGGSRRHMLLAWHYLSYYHNTYAMNQYLAYRGYIVLSVSYRSGT